jgi:hypothetical protein
VGGVYVMGAMGRCIGGVLEASLPHGVLLGGFWEQNQLVCPLIWNSIE